MRTTQALLQVAVALMQRPNHEHYGYELSQASSVRSGVLYPLLTRLLNEGWLEDGWEDAEIARKEKRPPRRNYRLTDRGKEELGALAARAPSPAPATRPRLRPLEGGMTT